jgi:hypothetical protein
MTSLRDTYESGPLGSVWTREQLIVALAVFTLGCAAIVTGILAATTTLLSTTFGLTTTESWEVAGILAGIGVLTVLVGMLTILPATRRQRIGATIGVVTGLIGTAWFYTAFPHQWHGDPVDQSVYVVTVYFIGLLITLGYFFHAVANFKTRNNPGGTVNLYLTGGDSDRSEK